MLHMLPAPVPVPVPVSALCRPADQPSRCPAMIGFTRSTFSRGNPMDVQPSPALADSTCGTAEMPLRLRPLVFGRCAQLALVASVSGLLACGAANAAGSAEYKYDALGRLSEVTLTTGVVIRYTYDPAGNRASAVTTGSRVNSPASNAALVAIITLLLLE